MKQQESFFPTHEAVMNKDECHWKRMDPSVLNRDTTAFKLHQGKQASSSVHGRHGFGAPSHHLLKRHSFRNWLVVNLWLALVHDRLWTTTGKSTKRRLCGGQGRARMAVGFWTILQIHNHHSAVCYRVGSKWKGHTFSLHISMIGKGGTIVVWGYLTQHGIRSRASPQESSHGSTRETGKWTNQRKSWHDKNLATLQASSRTSNPNS